MQIVVHTFFYVKYNFITYLKILVNITQITAADTYDSGRTYDNNNIDFDLAYNI